MKDLTARFVTGVFCFVLGLLVARKDFRSLPEADATPSNTVVRELESPKRAHPPGVASAVESNTNTEPARQSSLVEHEQELERELEERQRKNWPVLQFEWPEIRRLAAQDLARMAAQALGSSRAEYEAFFTELGLPDDVAERFLQHLKNIHRASREYEVFQQQILGAKYFFEKDLRASLTPEQYDAYVNFERERTARQEVSRIDSYWSQQFGEQLDESARALVKTAIQQQQVYTEEPVHGPFDPLPRVAYGRDQIMARLQEQWTLIHNKASALLDTLSTSESDPALQRKLQQYYQAKLQEIARSIEFMRNRQANYGN